MNNTTDRHSERHSIRSSVSLNENRTKVKRERTISVAESLEVSVESAKPDRFNPELLPKYFNNAVKNLAGKAVMGTSVNNLFNQIIERPQDPKKARL